MIGPEPVFQKLVGEGRVKDRDGKSNAQGWLAIPG